jgi:hypothetical protein
MVMLRGEVISVEALERLVGRPVREVLEEAGVVRLDDGRVVKSFRGLKGWWSSARWRPYGARFVSAARELGRRGVATVRVEGYYRVGRGWREVVVYRPVEGESLRELVGKADRRDELVGMFAVFLAELHERGVHPRSMHWGNVIVRPGGAGFGVIDMTATRFWRGAVPVWARARDFRPVLAYKRERAAAVAFGVRRLEKVYVEAAKLSGRKRGLFVWCLRRQHEELAKALRGDTHKR